jgi:hypothetical protein
VSFREDLVGVFEEGWRQSCPESSRVSDSEDPAALLMYLTIAAYGSSVVTKK